MQTVSNLPKDTNEIDPIPDFVPVLLREIELGQPLRPLSAFDDEKEQSYQRARCLIRLHTQPLGLVELTFVSNKLSPEEYAPVIWQALSTQINAHLRADGLQELTELDLTGLAGERMPRCLQERAAFLQTAPFVSVVLCTRDRPERLTRFFSSLLSQVYPDYEVIVVDNAPSTSATADFVQRNYGDNPRVRYVREDQPGLTSARNRGILAARGKIIAFTDDDVLVDAHWLSGLVRGFSKSEDVVCVTGLVLTMEMDTPAQRLFDAYGQFTKGFEPRIFDMREHRWRKPSFPYIIGAVGVGASMAFTADFLQKEGGLDPALAAGDDLSLFFHVIVKGHRLVYQPSSLLYHQHRKDYADLQRQIYEYGSGFTAYLTKLMLDRPWLLFDLLQKFARSILFLLRAGSPRPEEEQKEIVPYPPDLKHLERQGRLRGPFVYIRRRWASGWTSKGLALTQQRIDLARSRSVADQAQASAAKGVKV